MLGKFVKYTRKFSFSMFSIFFITQSSKHSKFAKVSTHHITQTNILLENTENSHITNKLRLSVVYKYRLHFLTCRSTYYKGQNHKSMHAKFPKKNEHANKIL